AVSEVESFSTGSGNLVTGTFCHLATQTIDLVIDGVAPIGCTPNHPFWSVDRRAFVNAGELLVGENVQLYSGETKRVVQKLARPSPELVYNIEVLGEHVYHVTTDGVLVHNMCASRKPTEGHHPIPKFMGGNKKQDLYDVDRLLHRGADKYHSLLSAALQRKLGLPGNASKEAWRELMESTAGAQKQALDTLLDVSRKFDAEHGTEFTQQVWRQIMQKGFEVFP
ncbi:MAG: polymorphic toxin-type HINT domain-containing protein, partial [Thermoguttaceae bacterium]|nr:polymorphic toxin-type HINT domain-containing protein [Thermoguttaceae bacterium]